MLDVDAQPAMMAALAPYIAAHGPWALREPNSLTGRLVARHTREAFVATAIHLRDALKTASFPDEFFIVVKVPVATKPDHMRRPPSVLA